MFPKLLNYCAALAVLGIAALVYQFTLVAWLDPPQVAIAEIEHISQSIEPSRLDQMFADGTWQRSAQKRLTIKDQGFVLFSERKQITPSHWRVWPVTVVMQRDDGPPIIMDAPQGADITFAEPLDVLGSEAPPIKGGQLVGKVTIRSVPAQHGQPIALRDQLEIQAQDVGIDNRRIWTNEAILMRWGGSVLAGRNLTIRLAGGGTIPTSGTQSPLSILDSMELIYLDRLELPVPAPKQPAADVAAGEPRPEKVPDGRASIQCKGRVTFDFATDLLRLRDSVRIEHKPHQGPADTIECDAVTLEFNNPLADDLPRESAEDWLRRIEATGEPVIVRLPSGGAEAVAESILYDAEAGTLRVRGSAGVRIAYQGVNFQATDFIYRFHGDDPTRIGSLDCAGSGFLDFETSDELAIKTVRWSRGVKLQPLAEEDLHEILIDGDVTTTLSDGGKILADALRFSFRQSSAEGEDDPATADQAEALAQFRPERASATGDVVFDTALMYVETKLLQLFFEVQAPADATAAATGVQLNPAAGAAKRFWVRQPDQSADTLSPVARPRPTLTADSVHANLTLAGREVIGSDLSVVGNVRLQHRLITPQAMLPLKIAGEKLRIVSQNGHDMVQINGAAEPARFDLGDGYFVGPLIRMSTSDNYVWINQAGHFQIPTALLPAGDAGAAIQWSSSPRCAWSGEMFFDGRTVELTGGVQLSSQMKVGKDLTPWSIAATAERMQIALDQAVQIQNTDALRSAKIDGVSLISSDTQPVFVTADQADVRGNLQARHVLNAPRLTLQPQTGQLQGPGPGWYRQWTVPNADGPFAGFVPSGGLLGTHLIFADKLQGELAQRQLSFHGGTRIGVRPVGSWDEVFDAATMDALAAGQATIDCQTLRIAQSPTPGALAAPAGGGLLQQGAWEIEAAGSVAFRARNERGLFETTGDRASYAAVKDLFIIEGDGRRPATLRQTQPDGLPGFNIALHNIKIRPKTMEIDTQLQSASPGVLPAHMRLRRD